MEVIKRRIVISEVIPFTGEMFAGFYEQVFKLWQYKQEIRIDRVFSRN